MRYRVRVSRDRQIVLVLIAALLTLSGCVPSGFAQTPFQREAGDAASSFSAAAMTLEQLHTGQLDHGYARGSIVVYQQAVRDVETTLASADGAPDSSTLDPVLTKVTEAHQVLDHPCLEGQCDWQAQVRALEAARDALVEVSA